MNLALKIFNFTCFSARKMSKKKLDSFQLCELCGRLVYSRQLADHRAVCGADSFSEDHKSAFIQDGVLHALVVERNNKMISGSSDRSDLRLMVMFFFLSLNQVFALNQS